MTPDKHSPHAGSPCLEIELILADYADGCLNAAEHEGVTRHLDRCPACRAELGRELHLRGELGSLPVEKCPEQVTDRILAALDAESRQQPTQAEPGPAPRWNGRLRTWGAAAVAVAATVVFLVTGPLSRAPGPQELDTEHSPYSEAEIKLAKAELTQGLLLTLQHLDRSERAAVKEVFGRALPASFKRSLKTVITPPEGGQG